MLFFLFHSFFLSYSFSFSLPSSLHPFLLSAPLFPFPVLPLRLSVILSPL
uniref:Uncharacterized protein n=1 Tax=Anguilla anguilla TaxID=7936 RepID=A0A0E9U0J5_ANGAN